MIILGPCACQGCGVNVYFDGHRWVDPSGRRHACYRRWWPLPKNNPTLRWKG